MVTASSVLLGAGLVSAQPYFLNDTFKPDPYRKPGDPTCTTCHRDMSGGALGEFGEAFQNEGTNITPLLRARFPKLFEYPTAKVGEITVHFSDPENKTVVVEVGGKHIVIDVAKRTAEEAVVR